MLEICAEKYQGIMDMLDKLGISQEGNNINHAVNYILQMNGFINNLHVIYLQYIYIYI